jgi:ATP-dependent DNA ligase
VIDGELVMLDDKGMTLFHRLRARIARKRRPPHRASPGRAEVWTNVKTPALKRNA